MKSFIEKNLETLMHEVSLCPAVAVVKGRMQDDGRWAGQERFLYLAVVTGSDELLLRQRMAT
jgi:hypothetical protein